MVNGNIKKPSIIKEVFTGWAYLIFAEVLALLVNLFTAGLMMKNMILKGFVGLCTISLLGCIVGNFAYNCAKNHKAYERTEKKSHNENRHILLSFLISSPLILEWLTLIVCKFTHNSFGDKIFSIYRTLNAYYLPWTNVICPTHLLEDLSIMGIITLLVCTLVPVATFIIVYNITYHNIDIEKIILYNKE